MRHLPNGKRSLFLEVIHFIQIILISPAANTISEKHFSTLTMIKILTRSTMTDSKLDHYDTYNPYDTYL